MMRKLFALRPADTLTALFLFSLIVLTIFFRENIPHTLRLLLIYSALFSLQAWLMLDGAPKTSQKDPEEGGSLEIASPSHRGNRTPLRVLDYFRNLVFPVICVLVIFDSLGMIVHHINPKDIDPLLIRLDYLIFNGYPTVMLESILNPLITDILQTAYSTYYFLPISFGLILKLQGREEEFDRALFLILLCFYLSYVGYMVFPALGPRYAMNHLHSADLGGLFIADRVQSVLNVLEGIKRDAFPSGHTAVALVVSGLAYRFHRGFFLMTLPVIGMLVFSTVYCRYHYVVDVFGGIILAGITFLIGERYYGYWEVRNNTHR